MPEPTTTPAAAPAAPATPAAPVPGTPEYDAAMAAKFEGGQPPAAPTNDRPAWLPEKFKTPEELAKAYAALETKLGQPPAPPTGQPPAQPATPQQGPKDGLKLEDAQAAVSKAGLDFDALNTEFAEKGALSPETFAKLEAGGIPKPMVEAYIAGQMALAAQFENSIHESVGGKESFDQIQAWANQNLSTAEREALNSAVDAGNLDAVKLAYAGIKARFEATYGRTGTQVQGSPAAAVDAYESYAQMKADMRNPLYSSDPAFRQKVMDKIGRSPTLFPTQTL